jgi:DNA polymerase III subunit delta'
VAAERGFQTIGQPVAWRLAHRLLTADSGPATVLVHGPPGAGKGFFVDDLLATALCEASEPTDRPCNSCAGCRQARAHTHPDLVIASPATWRDERTGGESIVAAARRWLADVSGAPITARWRVIVIEHADLANEQVQNALLKALEEPGERQLFILVADDVRRLLPTIRSRARPVRLGRVPRAALAEWIATTMQVTGEQASTLARLADGRVGGALSLAAKPELVEWRRRLQQELIALLERGRAERMVSVEELIEEAVRLSPAPAPVSEPDGSEPATRTPTAVQRVAAIAIMEAWLDLSRDLAMTAAGAADIAVSAELVPDLAGTARLRSPSEWVDTTRALERIHEALEENVSPRLALETAMLVWPQTTAR